MFSKIFARLRAVVGGRATAPADAAAALASGVSPSESAHPDATEHGHATDAPADDTSLRPAIVQLRAALSDVKAPHAAPPAAPVSTVAIDASVSGLTAELRHRITGLQATLLNDDARLLLDAISAEPAAAIRQLPAAAQRALALTQQAEPPVTELTAVFEEDPTLAQALLTQANSGMYGSGRPCLSVRDALQRLGVVAARNVLMGHTVAALLCRPGGQYAKMVEAVWSHMVRTAPIARRVASAFNADPEEAFGLGLLHDVGKLVIFDRLTTLRVEHRRELNVPADELKQILRALHEPLGGLAVHNWNLGDSAASAVASHHRNPIPAVRDSLSEVLCVAEAAELATTRQVQFDLADVWSRAVLAGSAVRVERALLAA